MLDQEQYLLLVYYVYKGQGLMIFQHESMEHIIILMKNMDIQDPIHICPLFVLAYYLWSS